MTVPPRVLSTATADAVMADLTRRHGALMFHQSGGCCDGSAPMCYPAGEFRVGGQDILLGTVGPDDAIPVWIGAATGDDVDRDLGVAPIVELCGAGFSLEGPDGLRFIVRSRVFTDAEVNALDAAGPPTRGDDA